MRACAGNIRFSVMILSVWMNAFLNGPLHPVSIHPNTITRHCFQWNWSSCHGRWTGCEFSNPPRGVQLHRHRTPRLQQLVWVKATCRKRREVTSSTQTRHQSVDIDICSKISSISFWCNNRIKHRIYFDFVVVCMRLPRHAWYQSWMQSRMVCPRFMSHLILLRLVHCFSLTLFPGFKRQLFSFTDGAGKSAL